MTFSNKLSAPRSKSPLSVSLSSLLSVSCRTQLVSEERCQYITEQECLPLEKEKCKNFPETVCEVVNVTRSQDQCQQEEKVQVRLEELIVEYLI